MLIGAFQYFSDRLVVFLYVHGNGQLMDANRLSGNECAVSDWIGPYIVGANQNGNGNGQDFTGGNHNYDGGENSSVTGRTVQYNVWVDGKEPQDGKVISGKKVKIEVVNRIQGFNTKEQDGSGREILQETVTYEVEGGQVQVHTEIQPLEDITLYRYYGLQSVNGAWNDEIRYYAGETEIARSEAGKYSDSITDLDNYNISLTISRLCLRKRMASRTFCKYIISPPCRRREPRLLGADNITSSPLRHRKERSSC